MPFNHMQSQFHSNRHVFSVQKHSPHHSEPQRWLFFSPSSWRQIARHHVAATHKVSAFKTPLLDFQIISPNCMGGKKASSGKCKQAQQQQQQQQLDCEVRSGTFSVDTDIYMYTVIHSELSLPLWSLEKLNRKGLFSWYTKCKTTFDNNLRRVLKMRKRVASPTDLIY